MGWEELGNAVVQLVVEDLIIAYRAEAIRPSEKRRERIKTYEEWLRSEWCYTLCGVDGDVIIRWVRERGMT